MKKFLAMIFFGAILCANPQAPLIVEFDVFKEAEKICKGSDYTKLKCLVQTLKPYQNRIYTKKSGSNAQISVIFYALDSNNNITYPSDIKEKTCDFIDTLGKKMTSKLSGNGFSYALKYPLIASSSLSRAHISCYFTHNDKIISQTSEPISVIPHDFDMNLFIKTAQDSMFRLNSERDSTPNYSNLNAQSHELETQFALKAQTHAIQINTNASARTIAGDIDIGFSETLIPLNIEFRRDNGLCNPVSESANGGFKFRGGRYLQNQISINFVDVARGELELVISHNLDFEDKKSGKCLTSPAQNIDITNAGKILCAQPIIIKKRMDIVPHSFFITLENHGKQMYFDQHTFLPAIPHLPTNKLEIIALNDRNQKLKNFTKDCFAKDLSAKLEDGKNNFVFINEQMPDSIISKDSFAENSTARVIRKLSTKGINGRDLSPTDAFNSSVINLNDTYFRIEFFQNSAILPIYFVKPNIKNDWRIALLRGRIALLENTNNSEAMIANPRISYEFYCKAPVCNIADIESAISPRARAPKSGTPNWFINTMHPTNLKVEAQHLILPDNISVYSLGNVQDGIQTLALRSNAKGIYQISILQNPQFAPLPSPNLTPILDNNTENALGNDALGNALENGGFQNDVFENGARNEIFATFLYFSPLNSEIGAHTRIKF